MTERTCYIFAYGDFSGSFEKKENDFIIAADAGFRRLSPYGISPDVLIGDFDTIGNIPNIEKTIRFPAEKDVTDTELALMHGIKLGFNKFVICGALGGKRLEHTLANIFVAGKYSVQGCDITLTDGITECILIHNKSISFSEKESGFISIFSVGSDAKGVTLQGLKYELCDSTIPCLSSLGVSNEFTGKISTVSVKDGILAIVKNRRQFNEA